MSFIYKNPTSSTQLGGENSVLRDDTFGTNFSVSQVGGYMEVYYLDNLNYTIPSGVTGKIEYSGNTIPINYSLRTLGFLPDTITLNSDNISSGRRRLGMLVYVHETELTYQYSIDNYDTLWGNVSGTTSESDFGTTITTSTIAGGNFIDAWLDSSIEGVSGVTRNNARWKIFYGSDITVTGGTYTNGTASFTNSTGGTFNITGFSTSVYSDWVATGDNQSPSTPITITNGYGLRFYGNINSGGAGITTDAGINSGGLTVALRESGGVPDSTTFYRGDGRWETPIDKFLTGGTYNNSTGTATFTNNSGNTFNVSGFITGTTEDTYVTGVTYNQLTKELSIGLSDGVDVTTTGFSPTITGGSFNDVSITLNNNDGTTTSITGSTTNIYNSNGTLTSDRTIDQDTNHITFSGSSGVSIGTGTTSPVCALLELASENQGLLIPRMTQVQRINISTPIPGLLVYSTNDTVDAKEGLYMYKSLGWVNVL